MANDKLTSLISYLNKNDMSEFETLSPKQKARCVYKHFCDYYSFQEKSYKAKNQVDKDRFDVEIERHFSLAMGQLKSLSQLELGEYLSLIVSKLQSVIQQSSQDKLISNKMIFGTIIRQIPEQLNIENQSTFQSLKNLYDEFENEIIKQ